MPARGLRRLLVAACLLATSSTPGCVTYLALDSIDPVAPSWSQPQHVQRASGWRLPDAYHVVLVWTDGTIERWDVVPGAADRAGRVTRCAGDHGPPEGWPQPLEVRAQAEQGFAGLAHSPGGRTVRLLEEGSVVAHLPAARPSRVRWPDMWRVAVAVPVVALTLAADVLLLPVYGAYAIGFVGGWIPL